MQHGCKEERDRQGIESEIGVKPTLARKTEDREVAAYSHYSF